MYPKHMQGKNSGTRLLTAVLSVLVVFLAALCVLSWMLFSDPNAGKSMPQPSDSAVSKVVAASVSGKEVSLTPEEVAGWLNSLIQKNADVKSRSGLSALSVTAKEDGTADVYAPVAYRGKTFGVVMNLTPSFDSAADQMKFDVNSVHVGRLPVPVGMAMNLMESRLPSVLSRQGNTLLCDTSSLFRADYAGAAVQLRMTELKLQDRLFLLKFQLKLGLNG
ncbi:hypothetical protein EQM14_10510 [Caproiciproducens sp. NJN-50]|uniref:hypothetical protein n=1 Tax=Acutalibacteraceae TaxID=3082771 RepID=UPI000FFE03AD|nr:MULTISPECIES: hypothetical protein [Acutalibacteraceae]QAT50163.1 hypothetical protein EQM14_10510 [Caproiciproducens sp. NJN-50]